MFSLTPPAYDASSRSVSSSSSSSALAVASSHLIKPSVSLSLLDPLLFLHPPTYDGVRRPWQARVDDGRGVVVEGLVDVVSTERRICKAIVIRLVAKLRVGHGTSGWRDETLLCREFALKGVQLETGTVNSFPFFLTLDGSAPASCEHQTGSIRYTVSATVKGPFQLMKNTDLTTTQPLVVVSDWSPKPDLGMHYEFHRRYIDPSLGLFEVSAFSPSTVLASSISFTLTLTSPPPALTIYGIHAYVCETSSLYSVGQPAKDSCPSERTPGPKVDIISVGEWQKTWEKDFRDKTAERGPFVRDGLEEDIEALRRAGTSDGQEEPIPWTWTGSGPLPTHRDNVEACTAPGTISRLRFTSMLTVEIAHSRVDDPLGKAKLSTVLRTPLHLLSCQCSGDAMTLPNYADPPTPCTLFSRPTVCLCPGPGSPTSLSRSSSSSSSTSSHRRPSNETMSSSLSSTSSSAMSSPPSSPTSPSSPSRRFQRLPSVSEDGCMPKLADVGHADEGRLDRKVGEEW